MKYIHDSPIGAHGHLRSDVCLIDSRWVLKVSDVGISWLRYPGKYSANETDEGEDSKCNSDPSRDDVLTIMQTAFVASIHIIR